MCTYQKVKWKHHSSRIPKREIQIQQHHDYRDLTECAQRYTFKLSFRYQAKHQMILSASNAKFSSHCHIFSVFVMMLDRVYRHNKNQEFMYGMRSEKKKTTEPNLWWKCVGCLKCHQIDWIKDMMLGSLRIKKKFASKKKWRLAFVFCFCHFFVSFLVYKEYAREKKM